MAPKKAYLMEDKIKKRLSYREFAVKIWPYIAKEKRLALFIIVIIILTLLTARSTPILFGLIIDDIKEKDLEQIKVWIYLFLGAKLSHAFLQYYSDYRIHDFGNKVLFNVRESVMDHLQRLPISYFDKTPVGRTVTRITNDVLSLGVVLTQGLTAVFLNLAEIIAIIGTLLYLSIPLTLATLVLMPPSIYALLFISKKLRAVFENSKKKLAAINAYSAETLNGIKVIQLYDQGGPRRQKMESLSEEKLELDLLSVKYFSQLWPLVNIFQYLTLMAGLFLGALYLKDLNLTIGTLSAFLVLLQSLFPPIRTLLERFNQYQDSLAGADRVFELFDIQQENLNAPITEPKKLEGSIEFNDVIFKYDSDGPEILKRISFKVEPGQSVALVGRTGSGKTTITALLQKYYEKQSGEILIDGVPIEDFTVKSLRSRLAVVMQDNFLFKGTIRSNITLANEELSEQEILQAAERAQCGEIIRTKPNGLDSVVEERGGNFSSGEKQLISFARALAHDPDILILDEATANIDSQSERLIQESIKEITADRTSVIIAHRLSTILHCDQIILLDKGEIVERGSHQELMAARGPYYNLYQSQY